MNFMTLRQAGVQYPDMSALQALVSKLAVNGGSVAIYGGYIRDLVLLGHVEETGDMDTAMSISDFLALKPATKAEIDPRRQFVLHEPHLLFMLHQLQDDVFNANPRPVVAVIKPEHWAEWGLTKPMSISLFRHELDPFSLVVDADLSISEVVFWNSDIWVTPRFVQSIRTRTMTLCRCRNVMDFARTVQRVKRFQLSRYADWKFVLPARFCALMEAWEASPGRAG
jgi:hypothetical protein